MDYTDPTSHHHLLHHPPPLSHHHQLNYNYNYDSSLTQQQQPYSYFPNPTPNPNPNPNPNPTPLSFLDTTYAPSLAAASEALRPPGVERFLPDPYTSHVGYGGGAHVPAPLYQPPHTSVVVPEGSYYYAAPETPTPTLAPIPTLQPQQQQHYGVQPFSYRRRAATVGTGKSNVNLETKKQKLIEGGALADSVRVCSVCNVVCNSAAVYASHVAGEKHAHKALGLAPSKIKMKFSAQAKVKKATHPSAKTTHPTAKTAPEKMAKGPIAFVQSSYCEVCKIDCSSQEVLDNHKLGRKHTKNLQKLQEVSSNSASAPVTNARQGNAISEPLKQNAAPTIKKDLETKKQNVLNGGAAADAVKVCTLCNVVCNSQTVFNFHIAGQKHLSMVKQKSAPVS